MTVGQFFLGGLCGCLSFETVIWHEVVVSISARCDKGPEAEVTFEAAERSGSGFEVRPLTFEAVVVNEDFRAGLPTDVTDMEFFSVVAEVVEGAGIGMKPIGDDVGLEQGGGVFEGDVKSAAGIFGASSWGDEPCLQGVKARVFTGPKPAFLAHYTELGFIDEEALTIGIRYGERSEVLMKIEAELVRPTGDGVVGDWDVEELLEDVNDRRGRQRVDNEEVSDEREDRFRELHSVPVEGDGQVKTLDAIDRIGGDLEGTARKREVDFVRALEIAVSIVAIATKAVAV